MKRTWGLLVCLPLLAACAPCGDQGNASERSGLPAMTQIDQEPVLAAVNGEPITQSMLEVHALRRTGHAADTLSADERETLLLELVELTLIAQDARQRELDRDPMLIAHLQNLQRALLAQAALRELREAMPEAAELDALYREHFADRPLRTYHARHILVDDASKAQALIRKLDQGADFAALAKAYSIGPEAYRGGDLGWFTADQIIEALAAAAAALEVGAYSREPIQTRLGWHLLQLEGTREEPASREAADEALRELWLRERIKRYVETLRSQALIQLYRPVE